MKRNNIQKDNSGKWLSFQSNPEEMSVLSSNMEKKIQENMTQASQVKQSSWVHGCDRKRQKTTFCYSNVHFIRTNIGTGSFQ